MSQIIDDARPTTSSPEVKHVLDLMEDYEVTHTDEENARAWEWIRDYCKASLEV